MASPKDIEGAVHALDGEIMVPGTDAAKLPTVTEKRPPKATPPVTARSSRVGWLSVIVLLVVAGAGAGLYYFQPWLTGPALVTVETAALAPVTRVLAVNGRIAALQSVDMRALVSGTLTSIAVAEGDAVEADAELAQVDSASQQTILRQAVAGLDAALLSLSDAKETFARTEALGTNVARVQLDEAARAVQLAEQEVARTTAFVDQAQVMLSNYTLRAPMAGTVLSLNVAAGQSIDPSTVLMTIADLDQLVVESDVDEAYASQIKLGQPAVMQLAGETEARPGSVSFVSQRVDAATGGLAMELLFDPPVTAPIGLTVTINIIVDDREAALTVPRAAIVSDDKGAGVFVLADGIAQKRPVSVIEWPAARLIVTDGLEPGDVLITDATGIAEGQAVRVGEP